MLRHSAAIAESNGSSAASPSAANPRAAAAATTSKPTTASARAVLERRRAPEGGGRNSPDVGGGGGYISRSSAAAGSKFRVDGRVAATAAVNGSAVPGVPALTAALRDLRRRLREAELEVKDMREERVSVEKRDRRVSEPSDLVFCHGCCFCFLCFFLCFLCSLCCSSLCSKSTLLVCATYIGLR